MFNKNILSKRRNKLLIFSLSFILFCGFADNSYSFNKHYLKSYNNKDNEITIQNDNKDNEITIQNNEAIELTTEEEIKNNELTTEKILEEIIEKITISHEAFINSNISQNSYTTSNSIENERIYKYCPTSIEGNILYCSNKNYPNQIKDGIYLNDQLILTTTPNSWDSAQVCDPTVVAGNFTYNQKQYKYLMAYLGCITYDCTNNEIGFAVSDDLYNWIKVGKIVSTPEEGSWGVGQASLLNLNNDGNVILFYSCGTRAKTTTYAELIDCNNLNNIEKKGKIEIKCSYDFISNADFSYNDGKLYMISDKHPFSENSYDALGIIPDRQVIYSCEWNKEFNTLDSLQWEKIIEISTEQTSYMKNHNACFIKDGYGNLKSMQVIVSVANIVSNNFLDNLFTYRFFTYDL